MGATLFAVAQVGVALALGAVLVAYLAQDHLIFHPQPLSPERRLEVMTRHPGVEELELRAADGTRLHAWWVKAAAQAPLVLYFGGNAEEVWSMLDEIGDAERGAAPGVGWLLLDYRGYGASEGSPSEAALLADARLLYDRAAELPGVDTRRIYALGRSLGSGIAVHLASERALAGVLLVTPYDKLAAVGRHHYPFLPVDWLLRHRFDSLALAPRLRVPLLCLIAERDEVIPPEHAERLYAAWGGSKRRVLLEGATHGEPDENREFWPSIREFIATARA